MFKMRKLNRKLSPYTTESYKIILQKNNLSNNLTNSKSKKYCKDKLVNNPKKLVNNLTNSALSSLPQTK